MLYDKQTRSLWLHLTGECIDGPLQGKQLQPVSGRHVQWREWKRDHPATRVMAEDERFKSDYFDRQACRRGDNYMPSGFLRTIKAKDTRLAPSSLCYGVTAGGAARAYPFATLLNHNLDVVNDVVGGTPVVIIFDRRTRSAAGYGRVLDEKSLTFERTANGLLRELASGAVFDRDGRAIEGEFRGQRLPAIRGLQAEWYGWYAAYPRTSIYAPSDVSADTK